MLLLIKKHTDTLIEQTEEEPKETREFKLNEQMETFSFKPPINLLEEEKCLLAVISFETTNSVYKITDENSRFCISTPSYRNPGGGEDFINKLKKLLEFRH